MSFILAYPEPGGNVPRVVQKPVAAGAAFELGALLVANASDEWAECGADPASIGAVAESPYGTSTGFTTLPKREFPPGYMLGTAVARQKFSAKYTGTLPAANGGSYGVVRDTDSLWKVDFSDTTATRVKLLERRTNAPENVARVIVEFLTANIQLV